MRQFIAAFSLLVLQTSFLYQPAQASTAFRFSLLDEPHSLDPAEIHGSTPQYLFHQVYRGLFRYQRGVGLIPEGAESCRRRNLSGKKSMLCTLRKDFKYSDGSPVVAADYVRSFRRLVDPNVRSVRSEVLLPLKNAKKILTGKAKPESLGITAPTPHQLIFNFETDAPEFQHRLIMPTLAPLPDRPIKKDRGQFAEMAYTGPYVISAWKKGHYVHLKPNPHYFRQSRTRPRVEIQFVQDDTTNLRLYDLGDLDFLLRLDPALIPILSKQPDFFFNPMARFDYMGFGPDLKPHPKLREALAYGLNYPELQKLYHALGTPGCPSLPPSYMKTVPCYRFDLKRAKRALAEVPEDIRNKRWKLQYSLLGGDLTHRGMVWMQHQWRKHLGLQIDLEQIEQGMFLQSLKDHPAPIFRKGVTIDRPTCLAATEIFLDQQPENYLGYKDPEYMKAVRRLSEATAVAAKKTYCTQALKQLMDKHVMIPLGEIHFALRARKTFEGWTLNELNQLDLTDLRHSKK